MIPVSNTIPATDWHVHLVEIIGSFLCIPLHLRRSRDSHNPSKSKIILTTLLSISLIPVRIFLTFGGFALFLDTILSNSREAISGSPHFSEHLGMWCVYGRQTVADVMLRVAGIVFRRDISALFFLLRHNPRGDSGFLKTKYSTITIILLLFVSVLQGAGGYALAMIDINLTVPPEYTLHLIPNNLTSMRTFYTFFTVWSSAATWYSWVFVIVIGGRLTFWLEMYTIKCSNALHGKYHPDELRNEFEMLKQGFDSFGRIGGVHCLSLLLNCTLLFISFLSGLAHPGESLVAFLPGTQSFHYFLPVGIIVVASLGSFMSSAVRNHRDTSLNIICRLPKPRCCVETAKSSSNDDHEDALEKVDSYEYLQDLRDLFVWESNWSWKLNALQLFEIKASLIPAVVTTILTYFIFLFQLKTSERPAEGNCTLL